MRLSCISLMMLSFSRDLTLKRAGEYVVRATAAEILNCFREARL